MRIHRFYLKGLVGGMGDEVRVPVSGEGAGSDGHNDQHNMALIHQWRDIFRMKAGDRLSVFNESAGEWTGEFTDLDKKKGATIRLLSQTGTPEGSFPKKDISLYMALIKNSNFDLVVEKATELGVSRIIPVSTERTIKANLNFERLNKLAIEATEQSGRMSPPQICEIMDLASAISHAKNSLAGTADSVFFGHIAPGNPAPATGQSAVAALFIGPEGGWSESEIGLFEKEGVLPMDLGQFVLRAETAAIVGVSRLA